MAEEHQRSAAMISSIAMPLIGAEAVAASALAFLATAIASAYLSDSIGLAIRPLPILVCSAGAAAAMFVWLRRLVARDTASARRVPRLRRRHVRVAALARAPRLSANRQRPRPRASPVAARVHPAPLAAPARRLALRISRRDGRLHAGQPPAGRARGRVGRERRAACGAPGRRGNRGAQGGVRLPDRTPRAARRWARVCRSR